MVLSVDSPQNFTYLDGFRWLQRFFTVLPINRTSFKNMKNILIESHLGNANFSMETLTLMAFQFFTSGRRSVCSRDEPIRSGRCLEDFGRVPRHDPLRPANHVPVAGDAQERQTISVQVIFIPKFLIKKIYSKYHGL